MKAGTIKKVYHEKGFGFIKAMNSDIYFKINAVKSKSGLVVESSYRHVLYEESTSGHSKRAVNILYVFELEDLHTIEKCYEDHKALFFQQLRSGAILKFLDKNNFDGTLLQEASNFKNLETIEYTKYIHNFLRRHNRIASESIYFVLDAFLKKYYIEPDNIKIEILEILQITDISELFISKIDNKYLVRLWLNNLTSYETLVNAINDGNIRELILDNQGYFSSYPPKNANKFCYDFELITKFRNIINWHELTKGLNIFTDKDFIDAFTYQNYNINWYILLERTKDLWTKNLVFEYLPVLKKHHLEFTFQYVLLPHKLEIFQDSIIVNSMIDKIDIDSIIKQSKDLKFLLSSQWRKILEYKKDAIYKYTMSNLLMNDDIIQLFDGLGKINWKTVDYHYIRTYTIHKGFFSDNEDGEVEEHVYEPSIFNNIHVPWSKELISRYLNKLDDVGWGELRKNPSVPADGLEYFHKMN